MYSLPRFLSRLTLLRGVCLTFLLLASLAVRAERLSVDYRCDLDELASVIALEQAESPAWRAAPKGMVPVSYEKTCWLRFAPPVGTKSSREQPWLSVADLHIHRVDLAIYDAGGNPVAYANRTGETYHAWVTGRRALFEPHDGKSARLYLRMSPTPGALPYPGFENTISIEAVAPQQIMQQEQAFDLANLAIVCLILAIVPIATAIFLRLHDPNYALVALCALLQATGLFSRAGLFYSFGPYTGWLLNASTHHYLFGACLTLCCARIVRFDRLGRRLAMLARAISLGYLILIPLQYASPTITETLVLALLPLQVVVLLTGAWQGWRRGHTASGIVLAGLMPGTTYWLAYLVYNVVMHQPIPTAFAVGSGFDYARALTLPIALCAALVQQAFHQLRQNQEERRLLRAVFDSIPDIVYLKDKDSIYVEVNRAFANLIGQSQDDIRGKSDLDFFSAETATALRLEDLEVVKTGKLWHAVRDRKWTDGTVRTFDTQKLPFHDADGKVTGILGNARDISNQVRMASEKNRLADELAESRLARTEAELKLADDRASQMMQVLGDAVIGLDYFNCIESLNPAAERLLGYAMQEVMGRSFHELTQHTQINTESGKLEEHSDLMRMMQEHQATHGTASFLKADQTQLIGEYFYQPLVVDGTHKGAVMVIRDVTEKLAIEKQLRFLSRAVEDSPAAVMMTDDKGVITYVNHRFEAMYGYKKKELIGQQCDNILSASLTDQNFSDIGQRLSAGREWIGELESRHRNGNTLWTRIFLTPLRDAKGQTTHYLMLSEDTTLRTNLERRERAARRESDAAHRRLAEQEQFLRLITETLPAQIIYVDTDERITFCNRLAAQLLDRKVEDVVGFYAAEVFPQAVYDFIKPYYRLALQGETTSYTSPIKDGRIIETVLVADRGEDGKVQGVIGMSLDVTENRRNAAALRDAILDADKANQAKSEFLANMSHEIRTPMHVILGLVTLLQDTALDRRQSNYVKTLGNSAQLLLGIVSDILDFSKIEAGKLVLEARPFALDEIVEKLADLFSDMAEEKGLTLSIDVSPETPESLIGDVLRLTQVMVNLCSNALKFTQRGEVLIRIAGVRRSEDVADIEFSVTDTGIGMTSEKAATAFEAFAQADTSTTRRFGGTGLGLTICRDLVTLMGGQLYVQSQLGEGSCFYFSLSLGVAPSIATPTAILDGRQALICVSSANRQTALINRLHALGVHTLTTESLGGADERWEKGLVEGAPIDWLFTDERMDASRLILHVPKSLEDRWGRLIVLGRNPSKNHGYDEIQYLSGPITRDRLLRLLQPRHEAASPSVGPHAALIAKLGRSRILVVDDNPMNHEIIRAFLANSSCSVIHANQGQEAIEMLESHGADIVLMDCQMPVMDGYEATRVLRHHPKFRTLPIVALTANATEDDREKCLAVGMNDFLAKPVLVEDLVATLLRHLALVPGAQASNRIASPAASGARQISAQATALDFSPLIGIDQAAALKTSMDNPALLRRLLKMFHDSHLGFEADFRHALATEGKEAASRAAHSVKGDSASIGALRLKQAAYALERACRADKSDDEIEKFLGETVDELMQVMSGIALLFDEAEPPPHAG